jgi:hypothetical protein
LIQAADSSFCLGEYYLQPDGVDQKRVVCHRPNLVLSPVRKADGEDINVGSLAHAFVGMHHEVAGREKPVQPKKPMR